MPTNHFPQKIINILISIVDNYGDMGTALEWCEAYERQYPGDARFVYWVDRVEDFLHFSHATRPSQEYEIHDLQKYLSDNTSPVTISFLSAPRVPNTHFAKSLSLHIGYLSFDKKWTQGNESEHIFSTKKHTMIELVPSILETGAGLIPHRDARYTREELQKMLAIDGDVRADWLVFFLYADTFARIDWTTFSKSSMIFFIGTGHAPIPNAFAYSLLPTDVYYSLLTHSNFSIIRGDTTLAEMLQL